ncbi:hypothetical protein CXG81DRAFT_8427 [Caulochytrium protostelioides]|uniref:Domain of unknown function at the cortex 1 domain-containing protein n=1 Tax=Caulochytrium protostelioides TaxID=1555241 RepID=A0A4P9XFK7_9FUNG|nr:hypothetical protein CXG81DRAFT_8427 [Caulochytrium protostelioides]|eukprot:RKP04357.1 hypothetical protein CXG81DRAFT_8427 [Caulochytrium protostelioides]
MFGYGGSSNAASHHRNSNHSSASNSNESLSAASPVTHFPPTNGKTKRRLRISVGTDPSNPADRQIIYVNDDLHPVPLKSEHFVGRIVVRADNWDNGVNPTQAEIQRAAGIGTTPYFQGRRRLFSFQIEGRFTKTWTGDDLWWGTRMHGKLKLPPGSDLALRFAQTLDPGLQADLHHPTDPWCLSPMLCAMNVIHIAPAPLLGPPGQHHKSLAYEANFLLMKSGRDMAAETRKKFFLKQDRRRDFLITPDQVISADFYNRFLLLSQMKVSLSGFNVSLDDYWHGEPLYYLACTRDMSTTFFYVMMELVDDSPMS